MSLFGKHSGAGKLFSKASKDIGILGSKLKKAPKAIQSAAGAVQSVAGSVQKAASQIEKATAGTPLSGIAGGVSNIAGGVRTGARAVKTARGNPEQATRQILSGVRKGAAQSGRGAAMLAPAALL